MDCLIREAFQEMIDFEQQVLFGTRVAAEVEQSEINESGEVYLKDICQQFRYENDEEAEDHGNTPRVETGPKVRLTNQELK